MLAGIIIGIFVMSLFTFMDLIAFDAENDKLVILFGGPFVWLLTFVSEGFERIYKFFILWRLCHYYSSAVFVSDGKRYNYFYIKNDILNNFYTKEDNSRNYIVNIRSLKTMKTIPCKCFIINKRTLRKKNEQNEILKLFIHSNSELYNKIK